MYISFNEANHPEQLDANHGLIEMGCCPPSHTLPSEENDAE